MPKRIPQDELEKILQTIATIPKGAHIREISNALACDMPRRTLQRRLALLVDQKRLTIKNRGQASRYQLVDIAEEQSLLPALQGQIRAHAYVPLSPKGEEIRQTVRQPIQKRQPVGYNRAFLSSSTLGICLMARRLALEGIAIISILLSSPLSDLLTT